jgi:acyl-CoA synthetase (AMP-forming)/AMP-acid ligase II
MIQQAGGKLAPAFIKEMLNTLPETDLFIMYGQTEATARLAYLEPEMAAGKTGSIGRAIPGVRLRIIDSSERELGPNTVGEIEAEGENITLGYWNDVDATKQTFVDGRLRTGDLGYYDDDGYFYIVDRAKDFIKSRGIRFSSQEVEERVLTHPDVVEATVIGEPHQLLGEAVILFVVLTPKSDVNERDIKVYCRQSGMPKYMIPKKVIFLSSLPKTEYGKVLKSALREEFKQ